jgi:hypothetical protein
MDMSATLHTVGIGIGATAVMDLWAMLAQRLFSMPQSNWALVGRWVGHFPRGQFVHNSVAKAAPIQHELLLGWVTHYVTGIAYAALLVAITGKAWLLAPTLVPAVMLGLSMLAAPFLLMQPGMGYGIAAAKTPNPNAARVRSVLNHLAFGIGLYLTARLFSR